MTAPEQQPNNPTEPNGVNTAAPEPASDQPQYGQYANLDYGAMRSQFGPNYNPYLYGAPDPDPKDANGDAAQGAGAQGTQAQGVPGNPQGGQQYYPGGYPGAQGQPYNPAGNPAGNRNPYVQPTGANANGANGNPNRPADGHTPRYIYGVDVNDPNQNPLYGRWDPYAIIAFVFALIFSVPLLPAIMGCASMWRTRTFHMKGRGFAIAAVIINLITTGVQVWMWMHGISMDDLYAQVLNMYGLNGSGSGGSGTSGDSMSA